MNNESLVKELLVSALREEGASYVDLIQNKLNHQIEEHLYVGVEHLHYLDNTDNNVRLIAESYGLGITEVLGLAVCNNYDENKEYVNSDLQTASVIELANIYIDNIDTIWDLLTIDDKEEIANEFDYLTRDMNQVSYYIVGPEDEIESLISMANDIAVKELMSNNIAINEERDGAKITYEDSCLYIVKDPVDLYEPLMKVRKEVSVYATWVKYYYPNGDEELVYHKAK